MSSCANCGTAEVDDIKLKICGACNSVRYCGIQCQKEHWPKHKRECKQRAAEMRDELLFRQPESSYIGDCPICFLPLPDDGNNLLKPCCGKLICVGCRCFNPKSECPFCRSPRPNSGEEAMKLLMKRADANDLDALSQMGILTYQKGDHEGAFEYYTKAARLGDAVAHYNLSLMYRDGEGVEKDEKKELHHLEEAAIGGHPAARVMLAGMEGLNGKHDRAVKHYIIAAKLGYDKSIQRLKEIYANPVGRRVLSKDDFTSALREYQAVVDATKSKQREEAAAARVRK